MDRTRYRAIELQLRNLVSQKKGVVDGTGARDMVTIDADIDKLIAELRRDFGVHLDRGKILDEAVAGKDMLVLDGRIVLSPSGGDHFMGERLGAKLEIDHVPPGETLQVGWRWRTPASDRMYRFLVDGPAFQAKTVVPEMALDTPFWGLVPPAVESAHGLEIVAELYVGDTSRPSKILSTGFISMPERPVGEIKLVGAPDRVVKDSFVELAIGPWTPDFRRYSVDWFVDDVQVGADRLALRHQFSKLGKHVTRADVHRVKRSGGIRDKQLVRSATTSFEVLTTSSTVTSSCRSSSIHRSAPNRSGSKSCSRQAIDRSTRSSIESIKEAHNRPIGRIDTRRRRSGSPRCASLHQIMRLPKRCHRIRQSSKLEALTVALSPQRW